MEGHRQRGVGPRIGLLLSAASGLAAAEFAEEDGRKELVEPQCMQVGLPEYLPKV